MSNDIWDSKTKKIINSSKQFWNFSESDNYVSVKASDNVEYKVWNTGNTAEVAETLARIRKDINTLLIYIMRNPDLWNQKPIAFGIYHTLDIHIPCWGKNMDSILKSKNPFKLINDTCTHDHTLFEYQEMKPDHQSIIGLNKPKKLEVIEVEYHGKRVKYPIAKQRKIFLTVRNSRTGKLNNYSSTLDLAIHELTHTTCNDVEWKADNHLPPYQSYHTLMRKWARECGILN